MCCQLMVRGRAYNYLTGKNLSIFMMRMSKKPSVLALVNTQIMPPIKSPFQQSSLLFILKPAML